MAEQRLDTIIERRKQGRVFLPSLLALCVAAFCLSSVIIFPAESSVPDNQRGVIEIRGAGVQPKGTVVLQAGKGQKIRTVADKNGNFVFSGLRYYSFVPLDLHLDLPDQSDAGAGVRVPPARLRIGFDPLSSDVTFSGIISPAGSVVVNVDGIEASSQIAGDSGEFSILASTPLGLSDGTATVMASIVNLGEVCCPKMQVPVQPVQLMISSMGMRAGEGQGTSSPAEPSVAPSVPAKPAPVKATPKAAPYTNPGVKTSPVAPVAPKKDEKKKSPAPYMILGAGRTSIEVSLPVQHLAASFPSSSYEATYVGGYKQAADQNRNAIMTHAMMIGAFLDGKNVNSAQLSLQRRNALTLKDYQPSDTICKFGTLTRSVAASESLSEANKLAFSKIFLDRTLQSSNTLYSDAVRGGVSYMNDFKSKYCSEADNNNGLEGYCDPSVSAADLFVDRDVNYTRVVDAPLTLDVNYTDGKSTDDEQKVLSLFQNIALRDPDYGTESGQNFKKPEKTDDFQDMHHNAAVRMLVANSFSNVVGMKAQGTKESAEYMRNVLTSLGLDDDDAKKLIGENPSYFAQMEILTKKLYQDPLFYANLYDTPTNVDRQKVAMLAVGLMQDRDLLESLKRKEILLSEILEMKLRHSGKSANAAGSSAD